MSDIVQEANMDGLDELSAHRIDSKGNITFKAGRTPSEDGKEFDAQRARDMGIPKWGRVEIPMDGRYQLRNYAKELHELADRLNQLSRVMDMDEVMVVSQAHREIVFTSNRLRSRRGPKPQHGDR